MPQKEKLNAEEKVKIVRMYQRGEISLLQAAQYAGVGKTTINRWITRYKAVQEYLSGLGSLSEISRKYQCSWRFQPQKVFRRFRETEPSGCGE